MTREQMIKIARDNVEQHLGDAVAELGGEPSADDIFEEVYTLAFDALADKSIAFDVASSVAQEIAQSYIQS